MKVFISRQMANGKVFPVSDQDYEAYIKEWKDTYDKEYKQLYKSISNSKDVKYAKASKDKRIHKKAKKFKEAKSKEFFDKMTKFEQELNSKYKDTLEIEKDYKDFDLKEALEQFSGQAVVGFDEKKENILVVVSAG